MRKLSLGGEVAAPVAVAEMCLNFNFIESSFYSATVSGSPLGTQLGPQECLPQVWDLESLEPRIERHRRSTGIGSKGKKCWRNLNKGLNLPAWD